jgi:tRNA-splicing ligase RtcB
MKKGYDRGLVDRQLVAAPITSEDGGNYFAAMASAANFAFNNRQMILHYVRGVLHEVLKIAPKEVKLLYDVCHNIAKFEEYLIDGRMQKLCVHRKGATRAFGKGNKELIPLYQETGQPVLVPGDMGTASHLMVGQANLLSFSSCCHGAGRCR